MSQKVNEFGDFTMSTNIVKEELDISDASDSDTVSIFTNNVQNVNNIHTSDTSGMIENNVPKLETTAVIKQELDTWNQSGIDEFGYFTRDFQDNSNFNKMTIKMDEEGFQTFTKDVLFKDNNQLIKSEIKDNWNTKKLKDEISMDINISNVNHNPKLPHYSDVYDMNKMMSAKVILTKLPTNTILHPLSINSEAFESLRSCWKYKRRFNNTHTVQDHIKKCGNQASFVCDHSPYQTISRLGFINHQMSHLTKNDKGVNDNESNEQSNIKLNNEINDAVSDNENINVTDIEEGDVSCNTFRNSALKEKQLFDDDKIGFKHYCKKCDKIVNNNKRRKTKFCEICDSLISFACSKCNKIFEKYGTMRYHVKFHCQTDGKLYTCLNCKKNYNNYEKFQCHVKICSSEFNYRCSFCMYKSKRLGDLTKHLKFHITAGQIKDDPNDYSLIPSIKGLLNGIRLYCSKCDKEVKEVDFINDKFCLKCQGKISLKCVLCNDIYDNIETIKRHLNSHGEQKNDHKYHCLSCDFGTDDELLYRKHKAKRVCQVEYLNLKSCWKCKSRFENTFDLTVHMKKCGNLAQYECNHCTFITLSKLKFINHRFIHSIKSDSDVKDIYFPYNFHCSKCKESVLQNTYQNVLNCGKCSTEMLYECPKCNALFENYYMIVLHLQNDCSNVFINCNEVDLEKKESYIHLCNFCTYKSSMKKIFDKHMKMHTLYKDYFTYEQMDNTLKGWTKMTEWYCSQCKESKPNIELSKSRVNCDKCNEQLIIRCTKCDKYKNTYVEIANHVKRICSPTQLYSCTKCDFKTSMSDIMSSHISKVHLKQKSICPKCKKTFTHAATLKNHLKYCGTNNNLFCDHCPYKTEYKSSILKHMLTSHLIIPTRKVKKALQSDPTKMMQAFCQKCNRSRSGLTRSTSICKKCNNPLEFRCKICDTDPGNFAKIRQHVIKHIKIYDCANCGKKFNKSQNLKKHQSICMLIKD